MANKAGSPSPPEGNTIEELAAALKTPAWALAGLKVRQNWAVGKIVTEDEFRRALQDFLTGPPARKG